MDSSIFTEISGSLVSSASSMNLISLNSRNAAWRKSIIKRLRERDEKETGRDNKYEEGISQVSESLKKSCVEWFDIELGKVEW